MKTIKPSAVALLSRTFEYRGRFRFVVTPMLFVSLGGGIRMRSEAALWQFVAEEMGKEAAIDAGMPKTTAEFLVHGCAHPPEGKPVGACAVRARFAGREKILHAFGDRYWQGQTPTEPRPFAAMPLDSSHAFGGLGFAANPAGKGAAKILHDGAALWPLPNVEYPDDRSLRPGQPIRPAGYASRDVTHPERMALTGTYDDNWLKTDFPGLPADADWRYFNVAAPDQWLESPFAGNEHWEFENLHPSQRLLRGELPGIATRCFITRSIGGEERFEEIPTRFDTVWFFPHRECAILVGRGLVEVAEDDAEEIKLLVAAAEWRDEARPLSHYREALHKRLDPERGHFFLLKEDDLLPSGIDRRYTVEQFMSSPPAAPRPLLSQNLFKRQCAEVEQARAVVAGYGLDPDAGHAPAPPAPPAALPQKLEDLPAYLEGIQAEGNAAKAAAEAFEKTADGQRRALFASLGMDYSVIEREYGAKPKGPPTFSARNELNTLTQLRQSLATQGGPVAEIDLYLNDPAYRQRLADAEQKSKDAYRVSAHLQDPADAMGSERIEWIRQRAAQHFQEGKSFAGIDLTGADLSGMSFPGADFSAALLESVDFRRCNLAGCNFDKAVLARAKLGEASLEGARLREANLGEANCQGTLFAGALLDGAILRGACFAGARFPGASLQKANVAGGADFRDADWSGADASDLVLMDADLRGLQCRGAKLDRSAFVRCDFSGVDFSASHFERASFIQVRGSGALFRQAIFKKTVFVGGAELEGADFTGAEIHTTNFRPSNLRGACFDQARIVEADLSQCQLQGASFVMATATATRFAKADLSQARLVAANLMNSGFSNARLDGADFGHANLYAADLARVAIDAATNFNLALTKRARTYPRRKRGAGAEEAP